MTTATATTLSDRVETLAWDDLRAQLDERGFAVSEPVLSGAECEALADLFDGGRFRSTIDMARYRFGDGRYRYFEAPAPTRSPSPLRRQLPAPRPIANAWSGGSAATITPPPGTPS